MPVERSKMYVIMTIRSVPTYASNHKVFGNEFTMTIPIVIPD